MATGDEGNGRTQEHRLQGVRNHRHRQQGLEAGRPRPEHQRHDQHFRRRPGDVCGRLAGLHVTRFVLAVGQRAQAHRERPPRRLPKATLLRQRREVLWDLNGRAARLILRHRESTMSMLTIRDEELTGKTI